MDSEDDEDICRICRNPGDRNNPLRYPCACNGSMKFVHQDCLFQWLHHNNNSLHCEVCKHPVSISLVYADNAPTRLPLHELVVGTATRSCRIFYFCLRLSFKLSVLLFALPLVTFWMCRLAFVRSFDQVKWLFLSYFTSTVILGDCLLGFVLAATALLGICYYCENLNDLGGEENGEDAALDEADGIVEREVSMFRFLKAVFDFLEFSIIIVGMLIFVPFTFGRIILYLTSWLFVAARGPTAAMFFNYTGLSLDNITLKSALISVTEMTNGSELIGANNTLSVVGSSNLSDVTTLTVGYLFIVFLVSLDPGISSLVKKGAPSLLRLFLVAMRFGIRVAYFVVYMRGVRPLIIGWLLDLSTVRMFGKTMSHRVEFLSISPMASSLVHWLVGIMYSWLMDKFNCLLREVLRPRVLFILRGPASNPIVDPLHKLAREALIDVAGYGSLIFILVFVPVKLAIWMAPLVFPLDISLSNPYTEIPVGMLLFHICVPFIMEHFRLQTTIKSLLCCWFTRFGWALGLTDSLLPRPEENIGQGNGNVNTGEEFEDDVDQSDSQYNFLLRVILLLLVACVTLFVFNSVLIVVTVSLGRVLFRAIPLISITHGIKCNDLYAFMIGSLAFWTTVSGARYAIEHVMSKRIAVFLNHIWKWCGIAFKSSVLLVIWVFIIPLLIGLLFELLVIVPMRVRVDESPVFLLYQDWALGLIFLKIWTRLVDGSWRAKFRRVREDGFSRLQGLWVLREILFPIMMKLLTALCIPSILAKGVFPMLGYSLVVNSAVYRFAWIGCLLVSMFCFLAKRCHFWFKNLCNSIRDDHYLIGRRLHNFGETAFAN